jgi:hypothetical protein
VKVRVHDWRLSVCSLPPDWSARLEGPFYAAIRTPSETTVIVTEGEEPANAQIEPGWMALEIEGPIAFDQVGVLLRLLAPLAQAGVPIFAVSTYASDVVLIKSAGLGRALEALASAGLEIRADG